MNVDSDAKDLISNLLSKTGTRIETVPLSPGVAENGTSEVNRCRVNISNERGSVSFIHYESPYNTLYGRMDDPTTIFISAMTDSQIVDKGISFEDFCEETGYDPETGKELAERTFSGLKKINMKLRAMFSDEDYTKLSKLVLETL